MKENLSSRLEREMQKQGVKNRLSQRPRLCQPCFSHTWMYSMFLPAVMLTEVLHKYQLPLLHLQGTIFTPIPEKWMENWSQPSVSSLHLHVFVAGFSNEVVKSLFLNLPLHNPTNGLAWIQPVWWGKRGCLGETFPWEEGYRRDIPQGKKARWGARRQSMRAEFHNPSRPCHSTEWFLQKDQR